MISSTAINTLSQLQITQAVQGGTSKVPATVQPQYAVKSFRIVYLTTDKKGAQVQASGLVSLPVKGAGVPSPVLSYQHATTFQNANAPSIKVEPAEPPIVLASLGYIVVAADYVGFGASLGEEHPYLTATPTANAVVDMLTAAKTWRSQASVPDNGQLFLAGYSEGGYATMAAHRAIQWSQGSLLSQVQAAVPGAGPYDVQETLDGLLQLVRDKYPTLAWLLDPGNLSKAPSWARDELRRQVMNRLVPGDADVSYSTLFLDRYAADDRAAIAAEHSVHLGWVPSAPVYLFHGRNDTTVPYSVSVSTLNTLRNAGAPNVSLADCTTPDYGHLDCVPQYFSFALEKMGRLARNL